MATYSARQPAHHALGISPRRQMIQGPARGESRVMARIERFLVALRDARRRSVFIVDNKCGDGRRLIGAARRARALGFVAIDAKGFDASEERIALARATALAGRDPAIGFGFFVRRDDEALPVGEHEADLMLAAADEDEAAEIERVADPDGAIVKTGG